MTRIVVFLLDLLTTVVCRGQWEIRNIKIVCDEQTGQWEVYFLGEENG